MAGKGKVKNDRTQLYKYLDFSGVRGTLESMQIRLSRPERFNDPFDMQLDYGIPITPEELVTLQMKKLVAAAKRGDLARFAGRRGSKIPKYQLRKKTKELKNATPDQIENMLDREKLYKQFEGHIAEANVAFKKGLAGCFVYCLSELNTHLLMWAHYADKHTGAVIRFQRRREGTGFINYAYEVQYRAQPPTIGSREGWLKLLMGEAKSLPTDDFARELVTTKSPDWEYEKEWRVVISKYPSGNYEYGEYPFRPDEIGAVYLGCRMPEPRKKQLVSICEAKYPDAEVFECEKERGSFAMQIRRVR